MGLQEYRKKRKFEETPEPAGEAAPQTAGRLFVVQKHAARRLHYDLRLELDGVLKSWAIPKGPSLDPSDKRMAVMVEDHPIDYGDFEGVIPEGNYGAGEVIVWDHGRYLFMGAKSDEDSDRLMREGLKKGHLTLVLEGEKLKGEFGLVRFRSQEEKDVWLLVKAKDDYAGAEDLLAADRSVISDRTIEDVRSEQNEAEHKPLDVKDLGLPTSPFPHDILPTLPTAVEEPFDRDGWLFEVKWDGYRAVAEIERGDVRLISRRNLSLNDHFPSIVKALQFIERDMVLDGEVAALDDQGVSRFQMLQDFRQAPAERLVYYAFDLLYLDGYDLRSRPLRERKELLRGVLPTNPAVRYSDHIWDRGKDFFAAATQHGAEGMVGKDGESKYVSGRTRLWLKVKAHPQQEAVICGYTAPRGVRARRSAPWCWECMKVASGSMWAIPARALTRRR